MKLKIADGLSLPLEVVTQTIAILAKRRAGKSYTMRRLSEQLLTAGQQVVIVDPKGDQWGLRSAANGKDPGLPIVILGGERGDAPLEASSGEVVAKLVVEERVSALLDLSQFRKHEVATFMTAFMENLYRLKAKEMYRTPMMLVMDEADAIAPQKPQKGEERMLGAAEDIVRRGGQRGIGCVLVTQRSAVLNKNVLTQAQILVVLRTIAPQDLAAMKAWIDVHGDEQQGRTLMESLPSLPIGDAWFWSPGWPTTEGIFQRAHVLPIETFDSGASPKPGVKPVEPKQLADVDLEALKRQMAATIEKAKQDDPRELRKRIAEYERRAGEREKEIFTALADAAKAGRAVERHNALTDADRALLEQVAVRLDAITDRRLGRVVDLLKMLEEKIEAVYVAATKEIATTLESKGFQKILAKLSTVNPAPTVADTRPPVPEVQRRTAPPPPTRPARVITDRLPSPDGFEMKAMHRALLTALAQHPDGLTKKQILIHASYSANGNTGAAFADLVREGYADVPQPSRLRITQAGLAALGDYEPLPLGDALRQQLLTGNKLSTMERAILGAICAEYPQDTQKSAALERAQYSANGNTGAAFAKLVALGYAVSTGPGRLKAAAELFG